VRRELDSRLSSAEEMARVRTALRYNNVSNQTIFIEFWQPRGWISNT